MASNSNEVKVNSQTMPPGLYLVATPIGNLGDITLRALEALKAADVIACEDTRVTAKLLSHFGIEARTLSYHEHNEQQMQEKMLALLQEGKRVALVSDAGTPLISDPGYRLVRACAEAGVRVVPLPGASSVLAALSASGLPTDRFLFAGFLPAKAKAREQAIAELAQVRATLVLFESPRRLAETLAALALYMGEREGVVARELTKLYEEFRRGSITELAAYYETAPEPKGEVVLLIGPPQETEAVYDETAEAALIEALKTHSVKDAAALVAKATGLSRQELYTHALALKKG